MKIYSDWKKYGPFISFMLIIAINMSIYKPISRLATINILVQYAATTLIFCMYIFVF